jgi:hypothetical protein
MSLVCETPQTKYSLPLHIPHDHRRVLGNELIVLFLSSIACLQELLHLMLVFEVRVLLVLVLHHGYKAHHLPGLTFSKYLGYVLTQHFSG